MVVKKKAVVKEKTATKRTRKPKAVAEVKPEPEIQKQVVEEIQETPKEIPVVKEVKPVEKEIEKAPVAEIDPDPVYLWKKTGGGSMHLPNRIIKPAQVFEARESEIPKAFMDTVEKVGVINKGVSVLKPIVTTYKLEQDKSGLWNIVSNSGKRLNEKPLDKKLADAFLKELL